VLDFGRAVITIPADVVVSVKGVVDFATVAVDGPGEVVDIGSEAPVGASCVVVVLGLVCVDEDTVGTVAVDVVLGVVCVNDDTVGTVRVDTVLDVRLEQFLSSYELW
jgi:hypothetical protein